MKSLSPIFDEMQPISLEEMKAVQLMNRVDTKYLMRKDELPQLFDFLKNDYYIQKIDGTFIAPYKTLYYDTEDVKMYMAHHNGKLHRQKLRVRCYRQSQTTFCEIKNKTNKGKTEKLRIPISVDYFNDSLSLEEIQHFVATHLRYEVDALLQQVENSFNRITLVNREKSERITIDSDIFFNNRYTERSFDMSKLVIIELKQAGFSPSLLRRSLQEMHISPRRISKYCLGTVLTHPEVRCNRFKQKIRYIEKIIN